MSEGEEEREVEEYEGEGASAVASLVSECSESGAQAVVPAPVQPEGEELGGFRGRGWVGRLLVSPASIASLRRRGILVYSFEYPCSSSKAKCLSFR